VKVTLITQKNRSPMNFVPSEKLKTPLLSTHFAPPEPGFLCTTL
jgi:hypothetical protein